MTEPPPIVIFSLLKRAYTSNARQCLSRSRAYGTIVDKPLPRARDIAIIGGGITGLTAAYKAAKLSPQSKVTVYEAKSRLGGWICSDYVDIGNGDKVLFESGPRSLRLSGLQGLFTTQLINEVGINEQIKWVMKDSPSAANRFIHDGTSLVRMPSPEHDSLLSTVTTLATNPMLFRAAAGMAFEFLRPPRGPGTEDESIESFLMRRTRSKACCDLVSAVFHGIYAGSISKLSAATILELPYDLEGRARSVTEGMILESQKENLLAPLLAPFKLKPSDYRLYLELGDLSVAWERYAREMRLASIFSWEKGLETLPRAVESALKQMSNVIIRCSTPVRRIQASGSADGMDIWIEGQAKPIHHSAAVWTDSKSTLENVTALDKSPSPLAAENSQETSVSVGVVNLCFPPTEHPLHPNGFGYLIPRSVPYSFNPECALGVLFDSTALPGQDVVRDSNRMPTKFTVMLGGHWWDNMLKRPKADELADMAKAVLRRHLGITIEPCAIRSSLHYNCIPQYTVGHLQRMAEFRDRLSKAFKGRLRVAGSSFTGAGVNDSIASGWCVASEIVRDGDRTRPDMPLNLVDREMWTGLEGIADGEFVRTALSRQQ
ncbi:MAG: oxygen-dependent protoporphyrinogen oxidase [Vezdaea aestivalis]|nr:MAG: oxygen-dependent protoporphyrinogen oxidase [Vezdaea aestivalis]